MEWVESKRGKRKLSYEGYLYTWVGGRAGWELDRDGERPGGGESGGGERRGEDAGGGGAPRPIYYVHVIKVNVFNHTDEYTHFG